MKQAGIIIGTLTLYFGVITLLKRGQSLPADRKTELRSKREIRSAKKQYDAKGLFLVHNAGRA